MTTPGETPRRAARLAPARAPRDAAARLNGGRFTGNPR